MAALEFRAGRAEAIRLAGTPLKRPFAPHWPMLDRRINCLNPIHQPERPMGFHQTATHKNGKGSYHQIGLVRGQFGGVPEAQWLRFIAEAGFDGWEEATWELDLRRCDTDAGAADFAKERVALAKSHGLEIFTIATHLQGQVLGDEPSAKTLNFCSGKGEARAAYKTWRAPETIRRAPTRSSPPRR